ncbi:ABC transporter ATP-binding protein [Pleomorphovibrio marinus]|uniref:ABC transporter ATP-binding protein/permease n=1 Tax=Pleomorphovibrio marinus TaxID=2164132 RepID=UPI000E0C7AC6|nr:ABC transporter ATP-binding protein/permease [Pleomorphovibrio marinus]
MDFETEDRVFKLVKEYLNHHLSSLLLITHQPTLAVGMDEVMILDQGKISSIGSPTVLLQENNLLSKFCQNVFELNRK